MKILHIDLQSISDLSIELRYFFDRSSSYEKRILLISDVSKLIDCAERDYYVPLPDLIQIGQRLYCWLDGIDRWLSRAIRQCDSDCLVLQITTQQALTHLPWEVLHDGSQFLVQRFNPAVVPVRWTDKVAKRPSSISRQLKVLFMATDPEGVEPKLDFEREEAQILEATKGLPLELRVEESGCVAELTKVWSRYIGTFDVFHLTGHASISQDSSCKPYFITETETGERHETTATELSKVFQFRWCPLIFLSGCRTGQAADQGAVKSMAEALLEKGAMAVLGWGRPVSDTTSITVAAYLYEKLASGYSLPQALALTYQNMLELGVKHWHLLRLYVQGRCPETLVEPLGDLIWIPQDTPYEEFLDPLTQQVRVANPQEFVGRRREIQYILRQLRDSQSIGILIHGMGGVGKSTITARVLDRLKGYSRVVLYQIIDKNQLFRTLAEQCTSEIGQQILNSNLPVLQCLTKFLEQGLNKPEQRFVFVLDDFECNLEKRQDTYVLKDDNQNIVETLRDLFKAIVNSHLPHRIILTSRYDFLIPELNHRIKRLPLVALYGSALDKKYSRLDAFKGNSNVDFELQKKAKHLADGNPRLLEYLNIILVDRSIPQEEILKRMEGKHQEFLEKIFMQALLEQLDKKTREILAQGLMFHLPIPRQVFIEICIPSNQEFRVDDMLDRAISLGVLESTREGMVRVPQLLSDILETVEHSYAAAAVTLYRNWEPTLNMNVTEEQLREIYRLSVLGNKKDITVEISEILAKRLNRSGRYREVVELCKSTLKDSQNNYRIYLQLSHSEAALGDKSDAAEHYQEVISYLENLLLNSNGTDIQKYTTAIIEAYIGIADVHHTRALSSEAIQYLEQALAKANEIQDKKSIADIYLLMGIVNRTEGDFLSSIEHILLGFNFYKEVENKPGEAEASHNLADSYLRLGKLEDAARITCEAITKHEQVGNFKEQSWSLSLLGNIYLAQKKLQIAQETLEEAVNRFQEIQHLHGTFITTYRLGCLFVVRKSFAKSSEYLSRLYQLDTYSENSMRSLAYGYINLLEGDLLYAKKQFDLAIVSYSNIINKLDRSRHSWMFSNLKLKLSRLYFSTHEYAVSLEHSEQAISIALNKQYNDILASAYSLSAQSLCAAHSRIDEEVESRVQNALKFSVLFNCYLTDDIFNELKKLICSNKDLVNRLIIYWQQHTINDIPIAQIEKESLHLGIGDSEPFFGVLSKLYSLLA